MKHKITLNLTNQFNDFSPNSLKKIFSTEDKISSNNRFYWKIKKINKRKVIIKLFSQDYSSMRAGLNSITNILTLIKKGDNFDK